MHTFLIGKQRCKIDEGNARRVYLGLHLPFKWTLIMYEFGVPYRHIAHADSRVVHDSVCMECASRCAPPDGGMLTNRLD